MTDKRYRYSDLSEEAKANVRSQFSPTFNQYTNGKISDAVDEARQMLPQMWSIYDHDTDDESASISFSTPDHDEIRMTVSENSCPFVKMDISDSKHFFVDDLPEILNILESATDVLFNARVVDEDSEFEWWIDELDVWFDEDGEELQ